MKKNAIQICLGSSCFTRGNERNLRLIEEFLARRHLRPEVDLEFGCSLCQGRCAAGPNVIINGTLHGGVDGGMMLALLRETFPETEAL